MDKSLASLIDAERQKIAVLEETLAECKGRLKMLIDMNKGDDEALNALVANRAARAQKPELNAASAGNDHHGVTALFSAQVAESQHTPSGRAKRGTVRATLLSVMGEKEAALADIGREMSARGFNLSPPALRTALWQAKKDGLTTSSRPGYHCLTTEGVRAQQNQK